MAVPEKYDHIDFKPPKSVAEAAERGLEYRKKANPSDKGGLTPAEAGEQGIGSGVQRATNLKNRNDVSPDVIRQMCAFFARHEKNKGIKPENKSTPWKQKGHVAWLLWGGDPGKTWAEKVRDQMDRADEKADKTARQQGGCGCGCGAACPCMRQRVASRYKEARGIHNIGALSNEQRKVLKELGMACQAAVNRVEGLAISVSGSVTDTWQKGKEYKRDAFGRMSPMAGKPHALLRLTLEANDDKGYRVAETQLELLLSQDGTMALTKDDKYGFRGHRLVDGKEIGKEFGESFNRQVQRAADSAQRWKEREQDRLEDEAEKARLAPKVTGLKERPDLKKNSRGWSTNPNTSRDPTYYEVLGENLNSQSPKNRDAILAWLKATGRKLGVSHLGYGATEETQLEWAPKEEIWMLVSYFSYSGD